MLPQMAGFSTLFMAELYMCMYVHVYIYICIYIYTHCLYPLIHSTYLGCFDIFLATVILQ